MQNPYFHLIHDSNHTGCHLTLDKFCSQKTERTIILVTVHYEKVSVKDYQGIKRVIFLSYYLGPKYEMKPENIF